MSFTGFYPETIDFLWGIRLNNNREWFEAHKADYQRFLWEPMKALAADVEAAFTGIEGLRMRVSRIYRDMRMHPPVPYKETSWMCLRHDGTSWLEHPCLFFELTSEYNEEKAQKGGPTTWHRNICPHCPTSVLRT